MLLARDDLGEGQCVTASYSAYHGTCLTNHIVVKWHKDGCQQRLANIMQCFIVKQSIDEDICLNNSLTVNCFC